MSNTFKNIRKVIVKLINCPNCKEILKGEDLRICPHCGIDLINRNENNSFIENRDDILGGDDEVNNIWLLTDNIAKENIKYEGKLDDLKHDIKYNVLRNESWHTEDLAYIKEINRLVQEGIIKKTTSYWFSSPFPSIFKAMHRGKLKILGKKFYFKKGDDIVWQCQMGREMHKLVGPVLIGNFTLNKIRMFCKEMENATKGSRMITR